ncbi:hypothetical protein Purlil1_4549 [Purpureocillium lilacinum]|uniref:Uncharacterized protein n=1 Tax=Purpureocillium lilacinum TaxID=33203 RepID=A0ABR0C4A1_PURLI|nr:hypothetical protein Purlil1_4549 [Purpureocillium lilacinum]
MRDTREGDARWRCGNVLHFRLLHDQAAALVYNRSSPLNVTMPTLPPVHIFSSTGRSAFSTLSWLMMANNILANWLGAEDPGREQVPWLRSMIDLIIWATTPASPRSLAID